MNGPLITIAELEAALRPTRGRAPKRRAGKLAARRGKHSLSVSRLDEMSNARLIAHCEARGDLSPEAQVLLDRLQRAY